MTSGSSLETQYFAVLARLVLQLRSALRALNPFAFSRNAGPLKAQIVALTAIVRRYVHALARELDLPPPDLTTKRAAQTATDKRRRRCERGLSLFEKSHRYARRSGPPHPADPDAAFNDWAIALMRVDRLVLALRNAERTARRLASLLHRRAQALKDLPLRPHQLRCLPPDFDILLTRLDQFARPGEWAALCPDTS